MKQKTYLAEQSFKLTLSHFGRGLLLPSNKIKNENLYFLSREAGELVGSSGYINLKKNNERLNLIFNVDLNNTPKLIVLSYTNRQNIKQEIILSESVATFGVRPYFECGCGRNASVLYLTKGQNSFKCRTCSRITYESTRINKQSLNGLVYIMHKLTKLANKREQIQRMYHAGHPTRKGQVLMSEYEAWQKEVFNNKEALASAHAMLLNHNI
ncbi:hypothetical protein C0583_00215 [Candidatus Parcubacteria bacterium]|nr:MAG: hypothetical protein C0583_00215 [Candidatus Parcubacteria bacterium]